MSYGKMNTFIKLTQKKKVLDDEGFSTITDVTLAEVHAYREGRHGSEKWANMAQFSEATDLFRFRIIPNLTVTKDMRILCDEHIFEITSVEDVKGRRMYIEVMAKEVTSSGDPAKSQDFLGVRASSGRLCRRQKHRPSRQARQDEQRNE